MPKTVFTSKPQRYSMDPNDPRYNLRENIIEALQAVPLHFDSTISIEGIEATDVFGLNQLLGGAIETQTVTVLNRLRDIWDPDDNYACYEFRRFPESFPDVRLIHASGGDPLIGIELKGWYLISKEGEPSFRFKASADAVTEYDLIACYPWTLSNVIAGKPRLHKPFIEQVKYAADARTYYWQTRKPKKTPPAANYYDINFANTQPYPAPGTKYTDKAVNDPGNNFGRLGRIFIMNDFFEQSLSIPLAGIEASYWVKFLKLFAESKTGSQINKGLTSIRKDLKKRTALESDDINSLLWHVQSVIEYMG